MKVVKKFNNTVVQIDEFKLCIFIFMFCGVLGFFIEEIYDTLYNLKLDKNGFLYGLFLPIYGWGALVNHFITKKTKDKPLLAFLLIMTFSAAFEYLTGIIIFSIWEKRFWDYSNYFMNLDGYICLFSVLAFSILGLVYCYIIEPIILKIIDKLGNKNVEFLLKCFIILYLIDNIFSFFIKNKF